MRTAKVFQDGRSQAIRLPKDFHIEGDEVYLKKTAEGFLVIYKDPWDVFSREFASYPMALWPKAAGNLRSTSVTNNLEHFSRVPDLRIVNWLPPSPDVNN